MTLRCVRRETGVVDGGASTADDGVREYAEFIVGMRIFFLI